MAKFLDENGLLYLWQKIKSQFVLKVSGKGLSTNDFTTALKNKLDAFGSADTYVVKVSGKGLSTNDFTTALKNKLDAFDTADKYALKTDIASMYKHKGSVASVAALPSSGQTAGDVYNVTATGMNYVWTGSEWDALGEIFTIESITNADIDTVVAS